MIKKGKKAGKAVLKENVKVRSKSGVKSKVFLKPADNFGIFPIRYSMVSQRKLAMAIPAKIKIF